MSGIPRILLVTSENENSSFVLCIWFLHQSGDLFFCLRLWIISAILKMRSFKDTTLSMKWIGRIVKKTWLGPSWPRGTPPGQNRWIPARPSVGSPPDDHDDGKYEYCIIFCSECIFLVQISQSVYLWYLTCLLLV